MRHFSLIAVLAFAVSACAPMASPPTTRDNQALAALHNVYPGLGIFIADYPAAAFDTARMDAFVRQAAVSVQEESFRLRREICASVLVDRDGQFRLAHFNPGTKSSCGVDLPRPGELMVADFHTHGVYERGYLNELPSPADVTTNENSGIPGYVTTPAGRLWYVDNDTGAIRLVCPAGCLPVDPDTPASTRTPMPATMSRAALFEHY